jgi:hypothetical protein
VTRAGDAGHLRAESRPCGAEDVDQLGHVELLGGHLVVMRPIGQPCDRDAIDVAHRRIEVDGVGRLRRVFAVHRQAEQTIARACLAQHLLEQYALHAELAELVEIGQRLLDQVGSWRRFHRPAG